MTAEYQKCTLCGRRCAVNRCENQLGYCKMSDKMKIARASLHQWEEPPISGERGSGTVFFVGCSLGCVYCQNSAISRGEGGREVTESELADVMLELQSSGAHNVNLVTPTHFTPGIISAVRLAKERGLSVPIVYNTSSYDTTENIDSLCGTVDVYLADLKYYRNSTAKKLSNAGNYVEVAKETISKMVAQTGRPVFDRDGMMLRGTIVRLLLLPGHLAEAKLLVKYLYTTYKDTVYLSLMSQYTPKSSLTKPLDRRVTKAEYRELVDYAERLGITHAFIQDGESASESFIPEFNSTK